MASSPMTNKEIEKELLPLIRVYKDGTIERLMNSPIVPPSLQDPQTGVSSKDIVISNHNNLALSARTFLQKSHHKSQKLPILLYFHGGAFCTPLHPLPAAYEDGWTSLQWVASHTSNDTNNKNFEREPWLLDYGDFNKVYIGGDVNGANIAHNLAMRAGSETLPNNLKILGALLCCPFSWGSKPIGSEPVEEHENSLAMKVWNFVYPNAKGGIDDPMVNPCAPVAPGLASLGCSKILVTITDKDEFRDRDILYYESIKKSGWQGQLELFEAGDEEHGFQMFKPETDRAKQLIKRLASFLV